MKNLTKMRRLILSILLTALSILLLVNALPSKASADDMSAIYNGTAPNSDWPDSSFTVNGMVHKIWMTAQNNSNQEESSNYSSIQPGITRNFLLKNGKYHDLQLHFKLTNPSTTETVTTGNEQFNLPLSPTVGGNKQIVYTGGGPVANPTGAKLWYDFTNQNGSATPGAGTDWSKLFAISVTAGNKIAPGQSIKVDVPLEVLPDTDGNTDTAFSFADLSYNGSVPTSIRNWARVASPVTLSYLQPGYDGYFVAGETTGDTNATLNFASGAQKYFPKIAESAKAISYDNTNSRVDGVPNDPTAAYLGGSQYIDLNKIPSATDTKSTLAADLHNNGYSFGIYTSDIAGHKTGQEYDTYQYAVDSTNPLSNVEMPNGFDATGQKYDNKTLGTIRLRVQQLLDASDRTIPVTKDGAWSPYEGVTFYGIDQSKLDKNPDGASYVVKKVDSNNNESNVANNKVDTTKDGVYRVTYTYKVNDYITVHKTITITVGKGNPTPPTTGTSNNGGTTTSNTNNNNNNSNNGNNSGNTNGSTTTTTKPSTSVGPNIAVKGEAVYAIKKIGLYKSTSFTKSKRIAWYPKQKRINRPMFVVTGYKRTSNGTLRYKVRDVNHGRKTAGKKGYITASRKYVVSVYYASVPKSKKITVIAKKGINTYKSANLTGKAKHYKKGVRLTVKRLVKHNLTTRYQLSNGKYVTANKKLIIAGNY
ncbi:DUF5776 domain-containing protein [Lentilactobacillus hilgardii]|nr:DUF5776 domain-containing protein [Lentilactobacillus hilgardii]MCV3739929.1 DUF5776 domain-containing protein [Lentilactobacillus hilgardii]